MPYQVMDQRVGRVIAWPAILSQRKKCVSGSERPAGNILSHGNQCTAPGEEPLRKGQLTRNRFG